MSINTADKGDVVLVLWADEHNNYQIYHEVGNIYNVKIFGNIFSHQGAVLHFLHTDSITTLGLVEAGGRRKKYITAEVVEKEYCQAKKAENRFRVRQGTKFYRVRCKLLERTTESISLVRSLSQAQQM